MFMQMADTILFRPEYPDPSYSYGLPANNHCRLQSVLPAILLIFLLAARRDLAGAY